MKEKWKENLRRTLEQHYSIESFIDSLTILTHFLGSWVPQSFSSYGVTTLADTDIRVRLRRLRNAYGHRPFSKYSPSSERTQELATHRRPR